MVKIKDAIHNHPENVLSKYLKLYYRRIIRNGDFEITKALYKQTILCMLMIQLDIIVCNKYDEPCVSFVCTGKYKPDFFKNGKKSDWSFVMYLKVQIFQNSYVRRLHTTYILLKHSYIYSKMSQATAFEFTKRFRAVVERMLALERLVRAKATTVSPPLGFVTQDRNRSYSSENNLSSLKNSRATHLIYTNAMKPEYGKKAIIAHSLTDLTRKKTIRTIKENGGKWFANARMALNDKSAVARILKEIQLPKKLEKVKNTFQNLGLRFYKPVERTEQTPMTDEAIQEANASVDNFLEDANEADTGDGATKITLA